MTNLVVVVRLWLVKWILLDCFPADWILTFFCPSQFSFSLPKFEISELFIRLINPISQYFFGFSIAEHRNQNYFCNNSSRWDLLWHTLKSKIYSLNFYKISGTKKPTASRQPQLYLASIQSQLWTHNQFSAYISTSSKPAW